MEYYDTMVIVVKQLQVSCFIFNSLLSVKIIVQIYNAVNEYIKMNECMGSSGFWEDIVLACALYGVLCR